MNNFGWNCINCDLKDNGMENLKKHLDIHKYDNINITKPDFYWMCDKCQKMIEGKHHQNCGKGGECECHKNNPNKLIGTVSSIWGTETETFSQLTPKMLRSIVRDTTEADIKSDQELSGNGL